MEPTLEFGRVRQNSAEIQACPMSVALKLIAIRLPCEPCRNFADRSCEEIACRDAALEPPYQFNSGLRRTPALL